MTEIKDCLPENARRHFIDRRNVRSHNETEKYQLRLSEFRAQMAARNQGRSGLQQAQEWTFKQELSERLAAGYVEDALETCRLYDIPLTASICNCLVKATQELLEIQYRHALQAHAQGVAEVRVPLSVRQQGNLESIKVTNRIKVIVETARVEDSRRRAELAKEKQKYGDTYTQNITQHGGVMNATQTGNISAQQLTVAEIDGLRPALAEMRAFFKKQGESVDVDEYIGLIASAEKAAGEKNESKMLNYLKQIPAHAWEVGKAVLPQVLLHYLKARGLA
jgi:hypothetical protein